METFYVLCVGDRYLDEDGEPCAFERAERFELHPFLVRYWRWRRPEARWVGPCIEGEAP